MKYSRFFTLNLLLALLFSSSWAWAQKGSVRGTITTPDGPAMMSVVKLVNKATTEKVGELEADDEGKYEFTGLASGTYVLTISPSDAEFSEKEEEFNLGTDEAKTLNVALVKAQNIDVVVYTSDRQATKLEKVAISMEVVSSTLADNNAINRADDALAKVPGVTIIDGQANIFVMEDGFRVSADGQQEGAGSRVLILVDDMPFLAADAGLANWRDIPIENMEAMEVLKGAGSALYGSSALNGIINIRTAKAKSKPVSKIAVYGTAYGSPARSETAWWKRDSIKVSDSLTVVPGERSNPLGYRAPKEFGVQFSDRRQYLKSKRLSVAMGGQYFSQDSYLAGQYERKFRINANTNFMATDKMTLGVNLNFNTGRSGSFFLWANGFDREFNIVDTETMTPLLGSITESRTMRFNVDPFMTLEDNYGNRHRLQTRIYYVNNQNDQNQSNQSTLYYGEYNLTRRFEKLGNLSMVAGAVGQYATIDAQLYGNAQYSTANAAAYVQLSKGLFLKENAENDYKLMLSFGARAELNNVRGPDSVIISAFLPRAANPFSNATEARLVFRAGANYELTKYTFLRASWGQGYRYPTIAERYISTAIGNPRTTGLEVRANPNLSAETGWSAEIGGRQLFSIGDPRKADSWKGFVDVSGFWTEYNNMMEFTFGGGDPQARGRFFSSINTGDTRIIGGEVTVGTQGKLYGHTTNILAGYTGIKPTFQDFNDLQRILSTSSENILKFRNNHTAKFDIESFFLKDESLSFGAAFLYSSAMIAVDRFFEDLQLYNVIIGPDGNATNRPGTQPFDAFGIGHYRRNINDGRFFDLQARAAYSHKIKKEGKEMLKLKFSIVARNLLNQEYTLRPALVGAPRNFTFRLDVDF